MKRWVKNKSSLKVASIGSENNQRVAGKLSFMWKNILLKIESTIEIKTTANEYNVRIQNFSLIVVA